MKFVFKTKDDQPLIRVCALKNQTHIDLKFDAKDFMLADSEGNELFPAAHNKNIWRARIKKAKSAKCEYYLVLHESQDEEKLQKKMRQFRKKDRRVSIKKVGGEIYIADKLVSSNEKFMIMAGPFPTEKQAQAQGKKYNGFKQWRVHKTLLKAGKGSIEIYDGEYENFTEVSNGFRLLPKNNGAYFQIKRFAINDSSSEKTRHEDLFFQGLLSVEIDEQNLLTAVNVISVEDYVKGILYSELGEHVQPEYAKTMAIVARSQIFARFGQCHVNEGFDFCSSSHCLRYYGKNFQSPEIEQAVRETRGQILTVNGKVCHAYFHYSCGGHTEQISGILPDDDSSFIQGKFDGDPAQNPGLDLSKEEDVKTWIESKPDVNCRIDEQTMNSSSRLIVDSFRWEVFYSCEELQEIIRRKTGEETGLIYEIIPLLRGVSGRIKEVEILGSLKNIRLSGELNIRAAFSESHLNSSCFIVRPELDMDGIPMNFLFIGAGKGHGVGLCKVGATRLACEEKTHQDIINHYFQKCKITRIY